MDQDFNTPQALSVMHELVNYAYKQEDRHVKFVTALMLIKYGKVLGLSFEMSQQERSDISDDERSKLISDYCEARANKDFVKADTLRESFLKKYGFYLSVDKNGTVSLKEA